MSKLTWRTRQFFFRSLISDIELIYRSQIKHNRVKSNIPESSVSEVFVKLEILYMSGINESSFRRFLEFQHWDEFEHLFH